MREGERKGGGGGEGLKQRVRHTTDACQQVGGDKSVLLPAFLQA
jgi:hypothetical protein